MSACSPKTCLACCHCHFRMDAAGCLSIKRCHQAQLQEPGFPAMPACRQVFSFFHLEELYTAISCIYFGIGIIKPVTDCCCTCICMCFRCPNGYKGDRCELKATDGGYSPLSECHRTSFLNSLKSEMN